MLTISRERDKYYRLLQLSSDQLDALQKDDMAGFARIMADKDALIASFGDGDGLLDNDPSLSSVVAQIVERDATAKSLLVSKLDRVRQQISELNRCTAARSAYGKSRHAVRRLPFVVAPDTPRFVDTKF
jgi:hypothetical protein